MLRKLPWVLMVVAAVALCSCKVGSGSGKSDPVQPGTEQQQRQVLAAAEQVADLLDAGRYGEAWASTAPPLSTTMTRQQFTQRISLLRRPLGKAGKRKIEGFGFHQKPAHAPSTEYGVISVNTDFANASGIKEKFTFARVDGDWKLSDYQLSKKIWIGSDPSKPD